MKNKLYYILLGLLASFSFMNSVFADDFNVTFSTTQDSTTVVKGKEITIKLKAKSDSAVDSCSFKVISDSTLEYVSMNEIGNWKVDNGTIANFTMKNNANNGTPLTNGVDILEIKYKVNGNGKVTIEPVKCSVVQSGENSYEDSEIDSIVLDIKAQEREKDSTLSNIIVSGGQLSPTFSKNIYQYTVPLSSPTFGLTVVVSDSDFQDEIIVKDRNGNTYTNLSNITYNDPTNQGIMIIDIVVNNKTTYTLATSYVKPELDNSLASLTIDGQNIDLGTGKYEYIYKVARNATSFELGATLKDSNNFQFSANGGSPGKFSIGSDAVYIVLIVEPKDSSSGAISVTYTIKVLKEGSVGGSSNNANSNPGTGDISMFIMAVILIFSLVGSVVLYQKNLESYK